MIISESTELRQLRQENAILVRAVNSEEVKAFVAKYARIKILLADLNTAIIAAGWHPERDTLMQRIHNEINAP